MEIIIAIFWMVLGFGALYFGAEWLVEGAVSIAKHLRISKVVAGVILVAFGTSAPELFVNVIAAVRSESSFALSNVSGSNLANLLIGFGICAVLVQLPVRIDQFRTDLALFAFAPFVVYILMTFLDATLPVWTLLIFLSAFSLYILQTRSRLHEELDDEETDGEMMSLNRSFFWFIVGCALLYIGGESTVRQAIKIGSFYQISEAILGLTVVALGTSIPDITASIVAARAGENEIAVGNLLGSNIFNVLFVIPMTLLFSGIVGVTFLDASEVGVVTSYGFVALVSAGFFLWVSRRERLSRPFGIGLILIYVAYMIYRVAIARG
jgi:cation:H+ antiporter